ncbi:hypothetical protein M422DRAFT_241867 [Sphaerobolus stellatus SS14]|nr:hypothetical protein M422DRAFT_241867 [Sphaerobolus stellatus SS14]
MEEIDEPVLRQHIRKLLLEYSLTHLTTNYVAFTETEVSELLSQNLDFVPEHDPTSVTLPVDPFEALSRHLNLRSQSPYEEIWKFDNEVRQLLTTLFAGKAHELPTRNCWSACDDHFVQGIYRLSTPVLATRSIRETPKLGNSKPKEEMKPSKAVDLLSSKDISLSIVAEEVLEDAKITSREREHLLGIRPTLDRDTHEGITRLLGQIPVAYPRPKYAIQSQQLPPKALEFLDPDSPPISSSQIRPISPPIFPRGMARPKAPGLQSLSDIRLLGIVNAVALDKEDIEDASKLNMELVDGWKVLPQTQSDGPTLDESSQSSEVDELFALTPPDTRLLPVHVKMDEYILPRNDRPRKGRAKHLDSSSSLSTFLQPLLPPMSVSAWKESKEVVMRRESPISLSILGQPPSPSGSVNTKGDLGLEETDLEKLIDRLCTPVAGQRPEEVILRERLDSKDAMMMDVPIMKEPNVHPPSPSIPALPSSIQSLLLAVNRKNTSEQSSPERIIGAPTVGCLKKVTGLQFLNIELSWRPFKFGNSIPKTEELIDVAESLSFDSLMEEPSCKDIKVFIDQLDALGTEKCTSNFNEDAIDWSAKLKVSKEWVPYHVALTRAERRRLYGKPPDASIHFENTTPARNEELLEVEPHMERQGIEISTGFNKRRKLHTVNTPSMERIPTPPETVEQGTKAEYGIEDISTFSFHGLASSSSGTMSQETIFSELGFGEGDNTVSQLEAYVKAGPWTAESDMQRTTPPLQKQPFNVPRSGSSITIDGYQKPATSLVTTNRVSRTAADQRPKKQRHSDSIFSREALTSFMKLRGRTIHDIAPAPLSSSPDPVAAVEVPIDSSSQPRGPPDELIDSNTLLLPSEWSFPPTQHRYIASVELIQKTMLVQSLLSDCNVDLVEREMIGPRAVDLILNVDTAVIFVSLSPLPVMFSILAERLAILSWDYDCLVVIFEACSASSTFRREKQADEGNIAPYAFSPAVIKAVRSLKRTLAIMENIASADGKTTKRRESAVCYAFAQDVKEAARFARFVGDGLKMEDEGGREWLEDDYNDDETDLGQVHCMNPFAAASTLRCVDLPALVEMCPEERLRTFGLNIGERRVKILNDEIAIRLAQVAVDNTSSVA